MPLVRDLALLALLALPSAAGDGFGPPRPPGQPGSGPGGAEYPHAEVLQSRLGTGEEACWVFEPDGPRTPSAGVVVLLHAAGAADPGRYGAWIRHLVRRGRVVLFPLYRGDPPPSPRAACEGAASALRRALARLDGTRHTAALLDRVVLAGHSLGGAMAARLAASADLEGLPRPRALFLAGPADAAASGLEADWGAIPAHCPVLAVVGEEEGGAGPQAAVAVLRAATAVAGAQRLLLVLPSDRRGSPPLEADRLLAECPDFSIGALPEAPLTERLRRRIRAMASSDARPRTDALDWFGLWKPMDLLLEHAASGLAPDLPLASLPGLPGLGTWSDGTPVAPAVLEAPVGACE